MKWWLTVGIALFWVGCSGADSDENVPDEAEAKSGMNPREKRIWINAEGRKIEASIAGYDPSSDRVRFGMQDGKEISYDVWRLSADDIQYIRGLYPRTSEQFASRIDAVIQKNLKSSQEKLTAKRKAAAEDLSLSDQDRRILESRLFFQMTMATPGPLLDDGPFAERAYRVLLGRKIQPEELEEFAAATAENKRQLLIDHLLRSPEFPLRLAKVVGPLLRTQPEPHDVAGTCSEPQIQKEYYNQTTASRAPQVLNQIYSKWLLHQLQENRKWDSLVAEVIQAEGSYEESPAIGYWLNDSFPSSANLPTPSHSFRSLLGVEISCAQCHDHPYEDVYQHDFYRIWSSLAEIRIENADSENPTVRDHPGERLRLPHDYMYVDGEPRALVSPAMYFGEDLDSSLSPRKAFAKWLTSPENPRFRVNIANRMWKTVFGLGVVEPTHNIPGHLSDAAQNTELIEVLVETMRHSQFDLKEFLRAICYTEAFQRESSKAQPDLQMIQKGDYYFAAPIEF